MEQLAIPGTLRVCVCVPLVMESGVKDRRPDEDAGADSPPLPELTRCSDHVGETREMPHLRRRRRNQLERQAG